jgi:hypothetical protein
MVFPIRGGRYEVSPGLRRMDLSHEQIFWLPDGWEDQVHAKWRYAARRSPCWVAEGADPEVIDDVLLWAGSRFLEEHPGRRLQMGCRLGMQVPEDLAIVQETPKGNRVVYLHVSFPNGWRPSEKIGGSFASVHAPVAHFDRMAAAEARIVRSMIDRGPFERFAWGVHVETELDRADLPDRWPGCSLPDVVFRVERQTTRGFPEHRAALFTIHTLTTPLRDLKCGQRLSLADALESMDEEARAYKGLDVFTIRRLVEYLRA